MARIQLLVGALVFLTAVSAARADHTEDERLTDQSPYTLRPGETSVSLWAVDVGLGGHPLLRSVEVGTSPWLWALNAMDVRSYNARGKYEFYADKQLSLAIRSAIYHFGVDEARLRMVPVELYGAFRFNEHWTTGLGMKFNNVSVRGAAELTDQLDAAGEVALSTRELRASAEYRLSRRTAFVLRTALHQHQGLRAEAGVSGDVGPADAAGGVFAETELLPEELSYNISLSTAWSWRRLNLVLGLQYGNPTVPGINAFVVPTKTIMPTGDLFWRF